MFTQKRLEKNGCIKEGNRFRLQVTNLPLIMEIGESSLCYKETNKIFKQIPELSDTLVRICVLSYYGKYARPQDKYIEVRPTY